MTEHVHEWTDATVAAILRSCPCGESRIVFNPYEPPNGKNAPTAKARPPRARKPYKKREPDPEKLARWADWQRLYLDEGLSTMAIANRVGTTVGRVHYALRRLGTTMRPKGFPKGVWPPHLAARWRTIEPGRDERILELARAGKTYTEIGHEYGLTRERVRQVLRKVGLSKAELHEIVLARHEPEPIERVCKRCGQTYEIARHAEHFARGSHKWLRVGSKSDPVRQRAIADDYAAGMKVADIMAKHGVKGTTLHYALRQFGVPKRHPEVGRHSKTNADAKAMQERIVTALRAGASAKRIAEVEGCSDRWVSAVKRKYGVAAHP